MMMDQVNIDSDIGKTLRRYRKARGLTQEELAVALDVGMTTISAYENGRIMPAPDMVSRLMAEMSKERPTSWADTGFGPWLQDELQVRGLSNEWLADQTGITVKTIRRYISGKAHPTRRLGHEIERKLLWYDENPEARRTVERKVDRHKKSVQMGTSPRHTTAALDGAAIWPEAIDAVRRCYRVGRKYKLPVRSIDFVQSGVISLHKERVTLIGAYRHVAVFQRYNGLKESYTWQELLRMNVREA